MAKKKAAEGWPRTVMFGAGKVRVARRANGFFALSWREMGATRRTTKAREGVALEWADQKARELDGVTGRRWVHASEGDALEALRKMGGEDGRVPRPREAIGVSRRGSSEFGGGHGGIGVGSGG